jgi:hypothetical protein
MSDLQRKKELIRRLPTPFGCNLKVRQVAGALRTLVLEPHRLDWSSYRHYAEGEPGIVVVMKNGDEGWEDRVTPSKSRSVVPSFAKDAKLGQPQLI